MEVSTKTITAQRWLWRKFWLQIPKAERDEIMYHAGCFRIYGPRSAASILREAARKQTNRWIKSALKQGPLEPSMKDIMMVKRRNDGAKLDEIRKEFGIRRATDKGVMDRLTEARRRTGQRGKPGRKKRIPGS